LEQLEPSQGIIKDLDRDGEEWIVRSKASKFQSPRDEVARLNMVRIAVVIDKQGPTKGKLIEEISRYEKRRRQKDGTREILTRQVPIEQTKEAGHVRRLGELPCMGWQLLGHHKLLLQLSHEAEKDHADDDELRGALKLERAQHERRKRGDNGNLRGIREGVHHDT